MRNAIGPIGRIEYRHRLRFAQPTNFDVRTSCPANLVAPSAFPLSPRAERGGPAVAEGTARVVVGARSALFLPYPELGLIVVD